MINIKTFSYYFFPDRRNLFRQFAAGVLFFIFLCYGTALGQRPGLEQPGSRPGTTRPGLAQPTRPGLAIVLPTRPGLAERSQRLGVQQVGEATAEATRMTAPRPTGPEVMVDRADKLVEQGKPEEAAVIYRKVIDSNPQLVSANVGLGYALIKMGEFDSAVNQFQKALDYSPGNAEAQLNLGVALYRGGRIGEAIDRYKKAIEERKGPFPAAHFNLAMAYAHNDEFDKSIEHYSLAIKQKGNYPSALNNLGLVYEAMGDLKQATDYFRQAIKQQDKYPLARYNLARLYSKDQATYQLGVDEFLRAIKDQPEFPEAYLDLGNLYMIRTLTQYYKYKEIDQAIGAFKKAIELREDFYPLAHENLAIVLTKKGMLALAEAKEKKAAANQAKAEKKEKEAEELLAAFKAKEKEAAGYVTEALAQYRTAYEQYEGQSPTTFTNLVASISGGESFVIGNELSRADNAGNLGRKKNVVQPGKQLADALQKYEELDEEIKDQPDIRYCAGLAFASVGRWGAAGEELALAVELAEKSGKKDEGANRALSSILELVRYF